MFTGIVQAVARVVEESPAGAGIRLVIDVAHWDERPSVGDSISVSGCCLTVAQQPTRDAAGSTRLCFDVVRETLDKTTLGRLEPGGRVNIEASLRADSLLGGHMVQGHIEGLGTVESINSDPRDRRIEIRPPAALMECMVPKGSIAIDGVSLTIAGVTRGTFSIALIPTTLEKTTLGAMHPGDLCNIETDILARTIVHFMRHYAGGTGV